MLPITEIPTNKITLPVLKKKVTVRAMTSQEEKILLIAKEAGTTSEVIDSIKNLITACIYSDPKKIIIEELCTTDIVALFIAIIDISKGSEINHIYRCINKINGKECSEKIVVNVDLKKVKYTTNNVSDIIKVADNVYVKLSYPDTIEYEKAQKESNDDKFDYELRLCAYSIDSVIENDNSIEFSDEEIYEWTKKLPISVVSKIKEFISNMPKAILEYDVICPKCKNKSHIKLTTLEDFFTNDIPEVHL